MTSFWNQLIIEKYIKLPCKLEDPMAQVVSTLPVSGRWHALLNERGPANTFAIRLPIWLEDCRESPNPKSIEALTACREIAFDKYGKGRISPIVIGETLRRVAGKPVAKLLNAKVRDAVGVS